MIHSKNFTVSGGDLLLPFTPLQHPIYYDHIERNVLVPKGRRVGATSSAAAYTIACLISEKSVLWVDVTQTNLNKYFFKYFMPILKQIKPEFWAYDKKYHTLRIGNTQADFGSVQKPENLEGFGYHIIILNEAGIILKGQKGRDLWYNTIYPMGIDYHAWKYIIGTPKGKRAKKDEESPTKTSLYYELCCKAGYDNHEKSDNYRYVNLSSYDNPLNDATVIKEMEDDVPRLTQNQELKGKFIDINDEAIFKEKWFPIVYELPPEHLWKRCFISMDTAFKTKDVNDNSAGVCFLETTVGIFWIDCFNEKLEFPELLKKTEDFYNRNNADFGIIEDAASGQSLLQMYKKSLNFSLLPVKKDKDKISRAVATTPVCERGMIHVLFGPWNKDAIAQLCDFNGCLDTPDDIVDAFSHGLNYIKVNKYPIAPPRGGKVRRKSKVLTRY
jgi:predicted phage terminase large subunit-like protein